MLAALDEIVNELKDADRQERIELLIDMAKRLPPLPDRLAHFKDEAHRVPECQSPVFLVVEREHDRVRLYADAPIEAPTVRGFVAILVEGLDGATVDEIRDVPNDLIERTGMPEILGMLRVRGLHGVLSRLKLMVSRSTATPGCNRDDVESDPVGPALSEDFAHGRSTDDSGRPSYRERS